MRAAVLDALIGRGAWAKELLDAAEAGRVPAGEIGPTHRSRLLRAPRRRDPGAGGLDPRGVGGGPAGGRRSHHRSALSMAGDPEAGRAVFGEHCALCHRLDGQGTEVGPDLAALTDRSPEALLVAILDPNRAFEAQVRRLHRRHDRRPRPDRPDRRRVVEQRDPAPAGGRTGRPAPLRDRRARRLGRVADARGTGTGPHAAGARPRRRLPPRAQGPPPKEVPGNHPEPVRSSPDGSIALSAETAELYGSRLTFEIGGREPRLVDRRGRPRRLDLRGRSARPLRGPARTMPAATTRPAMPS